MLYKYQGHWNARKAITKYHNCGLMWNGLTEQLDIGLDIGASWRKWVIWWCPSGFLAWPHLLTVDPKWSAASRSCPHASPPPPTMSPELLHLKLLLVRYLLTATKRDTNAPLATSSVTIFWTKSYKGSTGLSCLLKVLRQRDHKFKASQVI